MPPTGSWPPTPSWPSWAEPQLRDAVRLAGTVAGTGRGLAGELYRRWYVGEPAPSNAPRGAALAARYRSAGTGSHRDGSGLLVLDRPDHVGPDGWWRTWSEGWLRARRGRLARLLLTPEPEAVADLVRVLTTEPADPAWPWLLACPTDPAQLRSAGSVTLFGPARAPLPEGLVARVAPLLREGSPPLCRPLARGLASAEDPGNGMSFGEHRCHLLALALAGAAPDPLTEVARVFAEHGIDPAAPHRSPAAGRPRPSAPHRRG